MYCTDKWMYFELKKNLTPKFELQQGLWEVDRRKKLPEAKHATKFMIFRYSA